MATPTEDKQFPWKSGMWFNKEQGGFLIIIDGEKVEYKNLMVLEYPGATPMFSGTISQGDFGPVPPEEIEKVGGVKNYNLMMDFTMLKVPGVLHKSGTRIHAKSMFPGKPLEVMNYLTDEELEVLKEDREPMEAPKIPDYIKPQPGKLGKLLWFSGPPGAGKSITAQLLARNNGYVYYEADCMSIFVNPFVDVNAPEPSIAQMNQKPLKGLNEKTIKAIEARNDMQNKMSAPGYEFDADDITEQFSIIVDASCEDIIRQRQRLGGDWTVALAIFSRAQRDIVRKLLGDDVIFIILQLTPETHHKRLVGRGEEMDGDMAGIFDSMTKMYEPAGKDEKNAFDVHITEEMTPDDVAQKVLDILEKKNEDELPWKSGMWFNKDQGGFLVIIDGEKIDYKNLMVLDYPGSTSMFSGTISSGDFGPVPPEYLETTGGVENYNIMMDFNMMKIPGVLHESGTRIFAKSFFPDKPMDIMNCLNDEELEALKEDREPVEAPKIPDYIKPQPGKPGKMLWFSGPPGAGKSTTAQLLARNNGYIYYEADCMSIFVNPFIDVHTPEPSMAQMNQKPLKGLDEKTIKAIEARGEMSKKMSEDGPNFDPAMIADKFNIIAEATCEDIIRQRERLGGDWATAFAVFSRKQRDIIRNVLGNDVIFFILHLTQESNHKRLVGRHGDDMAAEFNKIFDSMSKMYESAGEDEKNAFDLHITEDMTPDDVVQKVLDILEKQI